MFAGYHLKDDVTAIPLAARNGWAGYCHECGPCVVSQGYILPEVFFFY